MALNCNTILPNYGRNCKAALGMAKVFALSPINTHFTSAGIKDKTNWTTAINDSPESRLFFFHDPDNITITNGEMKLVDNNLTGQSFAGQGDIKLAYEFHSRDMAIYNKLLQFNDTVMYLYLGTENNLILYHDNGTNAQGIKVQVFVGNFMLQENKGAVGKNMFIMNVLNPDKWINAQFDCNDATVAWDITEERGTSDVTINVVSASSTVVIMDIIETDNGAKVTSLVTGDFIMYEDDGTTPVAGTITKTSNRYTWTGTGFATDYIIGLKNQPAMTTKYFECQTPVTITVV